MKKIVLFIAGALALGHAQAQSAKIDTVAVSILDKMSDMIGQLNSCSAKVCAFYDVPSQELGLVKHSDIEQIYISGPNKMLITSHGDKGNNNISFNGKMLTYYSIDKNHYAQVSGPSSIIDMVDQMNKNYGIVFPMADFLYPTFVDDLLGEARNIAFLGMTKVDGVECFHIAGTTKDMSFQFWIADDPFYLPRKMVIVYTNKPLNPQYEAVYSDWQVNTSMPAGIFEFNAPPNARKINLRKLSVKK